LEEAQNQGQGLGYVWVQKKNKFWRFAYTWSITDNADMAMQEFT